MPFQTKHTDLSKDEILRNLITMRFKEGKTKSDLYDYLFELGYANSTCYDYIREAMKLAEQKAMNLYKEDIGEDIARWEADYADAKAAGNRKIASECLQQICKLKGHYIERKEVTTKTYVAKFGDEDLTID